MGSIKKKIPSSFHSKSRTRWSARVDCIKLVVAHLPAILEALEYLNQLNLISEYQRDISNWKNIFKLLTFFP